MNHYFKNPSSWWGAKVVYSNFNYNVSSIRRKKYKQFHALYG
jgi:hypothetical protein